MSDKSLEMFCLEITSIILLTQKETQCGFKIEFINPDINAEHDH